MQLQRIILNGRSHLSKALFIQTKSISIKSSYLQFDQFGEPHKVVQKHEIDLDSSQLKDDQVLVKMLVAPINPADINVIQGKLLVFFFFRFHSKQKLI